MHKDWACMKLNNGDNNKVIDFPDSNKIVTLNCK